MSAVEEKDFLALEDTLLCYSGSSETLQIPEKLQGRPIRAVGNGALAECRALRRVIVPEQIRRIGNEAFSNCPALETVVFKGGLPSFAPNLFYRCPNLRMLSLHRLPVSEEQYRRLLDNCCPMEDGSLAAERFPDWPGLDTLKSSLSLKPFVRVPKTVSCLFLDRESTPTMKEEDSRRFLELIRRETETPCVWEAEEENDRCLRRETSLDLEQVALFCMDDRKTEQAENGRLLHAKVLFGRFYWQAKVRVVCSQQAYYLYQRNYLSSNAKMIYTRRDLGVFTREGPVREEGRVRDVCFKYMLASIL